MMSKSSDSEPPTEITEQAETIPISDLETPLALPPPPLPEDEWEPSAENTNVRASSQTFPLYAIIPVILGVFSLLILILCGFFGYQYFQSLQASESKMRSLNQWIDSFQRKSEIFTDAQRVLDQNKETLEQLQNQNRHLIDALLQFNKANQGDRCGSPLHQWIQYREKCYLTNSQRVAWFNCTNLCMSLNATFLRTERSRLMNFLKLFELNHTWLGIVYDKEHKVWKWEDDSNPLDLDLPTPSWNLKSKCAYLEEQTIDIDDCSRLSSCLCEKSIHTNLSKD